MNQQTLLATRNPFDQSTFDQRFASADSNFSQLFSRLGPGFRTALIGDSYFGLGFGNTALPTTAGTVVVNNGLMTISSGGLGNNAAIPGNYVSLINLSDPNIGTTPLNGVCVPIRSVSSNNVFSVSASYNGATMPNGDYSSLGGSGWTVYFLNYATDSSHYHWHNYFNDNPFLTVALNAWVLTTSTHITLLMKKILAGPTFDVAFLNVGANDIGAGASATVAQAIGAAQNALNNIISICGQLTTLGKLVMLCVPAPVGTGLSGGNIQNRNIGFSQLRQGILRYAQTNPGVRVIDVFRDVISGTAANGDFATNFGYSDGIHLSSYGAYQVGKYEATLQTLQPVSKLLDFQPLTIVDDNTTYAQAFPAWAVSTAYATGSTGPAGQAIPTIVRNGGSLYALVQSGTSAAASTGSTGPSGTGSNIVDGSCIWSYQGPLQYNCIPHGMMDGTGGTNQGTAYGGGSNTIPTGWLLGGSGQGQTNVTAASSSAASQQARSSATNSNQANWGYGWNLSVVFSAAGVQGVSTGDISAELAASGLTGGAALGGWYRMGVTVEATAANTVLENVEVYLSMQGGNTFTVSANAPGNNTTTLPMANGDEIQIVSEPFYVPPGYVQSGGTYFNVKLTSSAAGTVAVQLASAFLRPIENPYASSNYGV